MIAHDPDLVRTAGWIPDLGPDGGDKGGAGVAQGTPELVTTTEGSWTGKYLAPLLARGEGVE